jgi:two-component SAPR family response regulator
MEKEKRKIPESQLPKILKGITDINQARKKLSKLGYSPVVMFLPISYNFNFEDQNYQTIQFKKECKRRGIKTIYEGLIEKDGLEVHFYLPKDKLSQIACCGKHK